MAILTKPISNNNPFAERVGDDLTPAGTYVSTIVDIKDEFDVVRLKYQSKETEEVDLTTFLFGYRDESNQPHLVASRRMKISGNEKSSLYVFLKSLLGRAPEYGWDYVELRGSKCLLTVEHVQRSDGNGVFAAIASISPLPRGMGGDGEAAPVTVFPSQKEPVVDVASADSAKVTEPSITDNSGEKPVPF